MHIEIDDRSGFCNGVVKTIELAEKALDEGKTVYCLGEIVHNEEEVARLKSKGLVIINHDDLKNIHDATILFRAHGEPPSTYREVSGNSNTLKEGTCPIVLSLQKKVLTSWEQLKGVQGQVVIYGKKSHAEVIGLAGQTNNEAIVISSPDDLDKIDFTKPVALFSQTTMPVEGFRTIIGIIRTRMEKNFSGQIPLSVNDSICRHVSRRGEHLIEFAQKHDAIVFVSGTSSSNGKVLYEICRKTNPNSYWVPSAEMLQKEWFENVRSVGISGATSTPQWLMEKVAQKIFEITSK